MDSAQPCLVLGVERSATVEEGAGFTLPRTSPGDIVSDVGDHTSTIEIRETAALRGDWRRVIIPRFHKPRQFSNKVYAVWAEEHIFHVEGL